MKNILCIRSDRLGEFLLNLPAIKLIRINYPGSKIYLFAKKENIELIKDIDFIDYFLEYKEDVFCGWKGVWKLANILKREELDCVVSLNPKREFHLASFLAKVPLRLGYDRKWGFCLNKKIKDEKYLGEKHEVEYNIDLVSLICSEVFIPEVEVPVDGKETLEFLKQDLDISQKYFVIHPFTSNPLKKIEDDFWANLVRLMKEKFKQSIVLIGEENERQESDLLSERLRVKNLAGKLTLRNLASFLKHNCQVFIGLDSGPMHLSSILRIPVVGLFKASSSTRWGPWRDKSLVIRGESLKDFIKNIDEIIYFINQWLI
jgi:heptosyltransferase-1